MKKYFTVVTAAEKDLEGKSFYTGEHESKDKSIDMALENFINGKYKYGDDTVLAIRTYDDISQVNLKAIRL